MAAALSTARRPEVRSARRLLVVLALATVLVLAGRQRPEPPTLRGDDYPYWVWSPQQADPWGFEARSCASFVAWRLNQAAGRLEAPWFFEASQVGGRAIDPRLGDAATWDERLQAAGFRVDQTPTRGSVAHWDAEETEDVTCRGHVAYVAEVFRDGTVLVEEYDCWRGFDARRTQAPRYLHVLDLE